MVWIHLQLAGAFCDRADQQEVVWIPLQPAGPRFVWHCENWRCHDFRVEKRVTSQVLVRQRRNFASYKKHCELESKSTLQPIKDLITIDATKRTCIPKYCKGPSEETKNSVLRLKEMAAKAELLFTDNNVNDCTKSKFGNLYGYCLCLNEHIMYATDVMIENIQMCSVVNEPENTVQTIPVLSSTNDLCPRRFDSLLFSWRDW